MADMAVHPTRGAPGRPEPAAARGATPEEALAGPSRDGASSSANMGAALELELVLDGTPVGGLRLFL
jgi:hypothetical protein